MIYYIITAVVAVVFALLGVLSGIIIRKLKYEKGLKQAEETYKQIVEKGKIEAETAKAEAIEKAERKINEKKKEFELDFKERRKIITDLELKLDNREQQLDRRLNNLDRREELMTQKESKIDEKEDQLTQLNSKAEERLLEIEEKMTEISCLTQEQARDIIMRDVEEKMHLEVSRYIKEEEEKARVEAKTKAKNILALAMQKYAADATSESTYSIISLPNEEMKGRVVGKEGRNIRTFEALTGVDIIIDDTPKAVTLSGFDPIRREVAKRSLEYLVNDGRIHPVRIEEVVDKFQKEVEDFIFQQGENAVFEMQIGKMNLDLIRLIGKLNFRTSFGQNVLKHSMEVGYLAGKLAAEIGENEYLARRAGLLHDIGKSVDHEVEGSHVDIGVKLAIRYKEPIEVIDAIASHHNDTEAKSVIAVLVAAADALSAARPGARNESSEDYIKRLEKLEEIAKKDKAVKKAYAIQAGRELRVMVKPENIDDIGITALARKIKEEIENELTYPGTVKVTVIREKRAVEVAK